MHHPTAQESLETALVDTHKAASSAVGQSSDTNTTTSALQCGNTAVIVASYWDNFESSAFSIPENFIASSSEAARNITAKRSCVHGVVIV